MEQGPNRPVVHNDLGAIYHERRMMVEAYLEFSDAIKIDPSYAMAYANRGVISVEWNALDDAVRDYRKAIELQPGTANFHAKLAYALLKQGRTGDAIASYDTDRSGMLEAVGGLSARPSLACLPAVHAETLSDQIIVVDDHSASTK